VRPYGVVRTIEFHTSVSASMSGSNTAAQILTRGWLGIVAAKDREPKTVRESGLS